MIEAKKISQGMHFVLLSIVGSVLITACGSVKNTTDKGPLMIQEQGSFAVGGTVITNPGHFRSI